MDNKTKNCPYCLEEIKAEATKCRWCRSKLAPSSVSKEWYRDLPGRRFLGVASVLAVNTGLSVMIWRILFILFTLTHGVLSPLFYFVIWAVTPFKAGGRSLIERIFPGRKYAEEKV
jgi:phage shock protein PspC (stress-responsive transcriptional regulator)